jgi:hypothetical protein
MAVGESPANAEAILFRLLAVPGAELVKAGF